MKYLKILIIGSGGREHAIGWKLRKSAFAGNLYFAPGNGGTTILGENVPIKVTDIKALLQFSKQKNIDLTVVGPETPLAEGIVDIFQKERLLIFGPTKKAARLEWDKDWASDFMKKYDIPHPQSYSFTSAQQAKDFLRLIDPLKIVIKASGLAAGKGVLLPNSLGDAYDAIDKIMVKKEFGDSGNVLVFQERLQGLELSIHALSDGKTIVPLLSAQDHKRVFDKDLGPNTGGMGAYAPVSLASDKLTDIIENTILKPTLKGMHDEGINFTGVLYAGLMITQEGPKVLEYNCRFGDPETQPLMMLLETDLLELLYSCVNGTLERQKISFSSGAAVCVVLTAKGYPGIYRKNEIIHGTQAQFTDGLQIFHAGTKKTGDAVVTDGGRVLGITAYASNFSKARSQVYEAIGKKGVNFKEMHYRRDIGLHAEDH